MDVATRYEPRIRAQPYLQSGETGDDADSMTRRKFQRTTTDPSQHDDNAFRKPSIPASAMRPHDEQRSSFSQRRRSTQLRDNVRVPSGPREFPSPSRRIGNSSISSLAPSMAGSTHSARSFLPHTTSEPLVSRIGEANRFSFGNPSSNDDTDSPTTPGERIGDHFEFLPSVNFDDFQNSLTSYDGQSVLLSDFPTVSAGRVTPKETGTATSRSHGLGSSKAEPQAVQNKAGPNAKRSQSLRRRLSAVAGPKLSGAHSSVKDDNPGQANHLSFRSRRQSSVPQAISSFGPAPAPPSAGSRAPRKSMGPGLLTSLMDNRKSSQAAPGSWPDSSQNPSMARTASLSKVARRTTLQPGPSAGIDAPRASTLTATTQSRQNKVKSLLPPPRDQGPNTPAARPLSKGANLRSTTPSSSGNKRQSTISGRASGLGARTTSPTDTRRLKRLSMMQAPPVPGPPTPQDEMPTMKLELPRMTQPSPSLIPRKANSSTPPSARASPEPRHGRSGSISLNSKPSLQSLAHSSSSQSRLPTPKPRSVHSSSAQYGEEEEAVPPVPAIPKAYESPRDTDVIFFSGPVRSSQSGGTPREPTMADIDPDGAYTSASGSATSTKPPVDTFSTIRREPSVESARHHKRTNTNETPLRHGFAAPGPKPERQQPDPAGRKNNSLQPLRLPPLNLAPINVPTANRSGAPSHSSQQTEARDEASYTQTPEPKRTAKTPSTPMTASKATFFRRHDEELVKQKNLRSSTSHFALRDLMDDSVTRFFDDSDVEASSAGLAFAGVTHRNAITPFASGSLPKHSGEYIAQRGRPSGEYEDEYSLGRHDGLKLHSAKAQGPRLDRSITVASIKSHEATASVESPIVEPSRPESKKESGGLRRRLSFGWHRSSSKAANISESKSSPQQDKATSDNAQSKVQKRVSEMPPPRLPASATWSGDLPSLPSGAPPNTDASRRKSTAASINSFSTNLSIGTEAEQATLAPRSTNVRSEQPQPVHAANRSSSWSNIGTSLRPVSMRVASSNTASRHTPKTSSISAIAKDKDDAAADEEMRRLSQKRRDVDTAARESEELRKRANARSPMSPEQVLHDRSCALNIFERGEVVDFEKDGVYFTGTKNARKIVGSLSSLQTNSDKDSKAGNYGYDDERGDYNIVLGDHLAYRYEVVDVLGKGSFGQVVRCVDHKEGGVVAVKIIRNKKRFHQQALVEVGILGRLREWDPDGSHATLSITSSFYYRSHLCIVTPCLSINLYELIRAHNFAGFSLPLIRRFARQLLACLVLLQNKRIIHCDLKPENILLCEARKADVRVIDFGSSCKEEEKVYTYIQSRFYRSPEVILGSSYGLGIDMWSFGCILAELWTGYPIFPGENEQEQLACIMEIFGPPDRHLVERCTRKKLFFDSVGKPRVTVSSKGRRRRPSSKTLAQALKTEDEAFLDFITRCLRWDPDRRMKPHEAISHPFITNQPFNQRVGIPEEARRAARMRASIAVPTTNGSIPSPVKRTQATSGQPGNAFAQQAQQTPAKERSRALPETPQTALRNGTMPSSASQNRGSPSKQMAVNKRQSTIASAGAAAVAGSKRASNGNVIGAATNLGSGHGGQRLGSGSIGTANLAALAARESMGTANAASRWRS